MIELCLGLAVLFVLDALSLLLVRNWSLLALRAASVALSLGGEWYWGSTETSLWVLRGLAVAGAVGLVVGILGRLPDGSAPVAVKRERVRRIPTIGDML